LVSGSPPQAGWLSIPGGEFSADPAASAAESPNGDLAWDSGIGNWLPTNPSMISPDGATYIPEGTANIEIADARTGTVIRSIPPGPVVSPTSTYAVTAWTAAGVYIIGGGKNPVDGLWLVDPSAGRVTEVAGSAIPVPWTLVDGSAAWAARINSDNSTSFLRLDLSTGRVRSVYRTAANHWAIPVGFVGSGVFVLVSDGRFVISAVVVGADGTLATVALPTGAAYDPVDRARIIAGRNDAWLLGTCKPL
jgi:hypothetical protein